MSGSEFASVGSEFRKPYHRVGRVGRLIVHDQLHPSAFMSRLLSDQQRQKPVRFHLPIRQPLGLRLGPHCARTEPGCYLSRSVTPCRGGGNVDGFGRERHHRHGQGVWALKLHRKPIS
jgi:hypothetical protein